MGVTFLSRGLSTTRSRWRGRGTHKRLDGVASVEIASSLYWSTDREARRRTTRSLRRWLRAERAAARAGGHRDAAHVRAKAIRHELHRRGEDPDRGGRDRAMDGRAPGRSSYERVERWASVPGGGSSRPVRRAVAERRTMLSALESAEKGRAGRSRGSSAWWR